MIFYLIIILSSDRLLAIILDKNRCLVLLLLNILVNKIIGVPEKLMEIFKKLLNLSHSNYRF